jgi:hypothetical protein
MKRLIFIALAVVLALAIIWAPSVAAEGPYEIPITKTIPAGAPIEDFTFEAWRDFNNNNVIDAGDVLVGTLVITGAGSGVINSPWKGNTIVHEVLIPGSAYEQPPDQIVSPPCDEIIFENKGGPCTGQIRILKFDELGEALYGATFEITPDPKTGTGSLTVVDNGLNDDDPADGVLLVTGVQVCIPVSVAETQAPDGYELDPTPQPAHVTECGETVTLTFVNTDIPELGQIVILKTDADGLALVGATFEISPNPKTGELPPLTVVDEGLNDEALGQPGILQVTECLVCVPVTVTETVPPPGYTAAPPQPAHVTEAGEVVTLTFVNTPELDCGTVCAAQTAPGETLFSTRQENWFTWISYNIGDGTELVPYTYPIYVGQTTLCGTLYVYDDGTHIFVNYALMDTATCTLAGLSSYHLQVDETFDDLKKAVVKGKNPVPGKCEYKGYFDPMVSETGYIECADDDISGWTRAYIFAHGVGCFICP